MQKVEDFRKHAEECLLLAERSREPAERDMLLNMAKAWDELAKARAAQVDQQRRMSDLPSGPGGDNRTNSASIPIDKLNASNDE
jgi:hypothetical protein